MRLAESEPRGADLGRKNNTMTKRWIALWPCASIALALAISCGNSDPGSSPAGGAAGEGGSSGAHAGSGGSDAGTDQGAGSPGTDGGEGGVAGVPFASAGEGGAAGSEIPVIPPLDPAEIDGLAMWMDGKAQAYSDIDENFPTPKDSGRVRSVREADPLMGSWQAPSSAERPTRQLGALGFKPIDSDSGYYLKDTAGTLKTNDSTLAISFRPLTGAGSGANGGISAPIGASAQSLGLYFVGNGIGLYFNHTTAPLKKHLTRGLRTTIIVRFNTDKVDVQYDIEGVRSSESIKEELVEETASNFILGYANGGNIYGYVSQVVGVDHAISDGDTDRLMSWLTAQPMPEAFPVSKPLIAILGDSIANGDQVLQTQAWAYRMLGDLNEAKPEADVQLLNAAVNGAGIPKLKNSDYSDVVMPYFSTQRAKNVLLVAAGTNDIANGNAVDDLLDRYFALLDSARATGWKVVAATILPRSSPGLSGGTAGFESARAQFNSEVRAKWATHADALADVASIPGMGAAGDSDDTKYYSADKIHPTAAGHVLLEKVYFTAVSGQM